MLSLMAFLGFLMPPEVLHTAPHYIDVLRNDVIEHTNTERAHKGLEPFTLNPLLTKAAQKHAEDMYRNNFYSHQNLRKQSPAMRIRAVGYPAMRTDICKCSFTTTVAENIAKGQKTPWTVVSAWMDSPQHRDNILSLNLSEIGIGIAGDVWVQNFGGVLITQSFHQ